MNEQTIPMLDLFSGIGGFALAAEIANAMADASEIRCDTGRAEQSLSGTRTRSRAWFDAIGHAEVEPFACAVYHRHFPDSVCFGGVQNVTRDAVLERCGQLPVVVTGGFPCQPHSCAGKRLASEDERDLWGECVRVLRDIRPKYALWENVGGLLTSESGLFFNRVLSDLAALRYGVLWQVVPASAVGAPHRRERVWIICRDELADAGSGSNSKSGLREAQGIQGERRQALHTGELGGAVAGCELVHAEVSGLCGDNGRPCEAAGFKGADLRSVVADCDNQGLQGRTEAGNPCGSGTERDKQPGGHGESCIWPAISGHWPSRPGEAQHGWEPPRVVGDTPQRQGDGRGCGGVAEAQGCRSGGDTASDVTGQTVGNSGGHRLGRSEERDKQPPAEQSASRRHDAVRPNAANEGWQGSGQCEAQPGICCDSDGVPNSLVRAWPEVYNRVAQLKGYGNAIVPQVAAIFLDAIRRELV